MTSHRHDPGEPSPLWVEAWRADVAKPLRVGRAYRRFAASRSGAGAMSVRVAPLQVARWVALGVVLGTSSLFAATRIATWLTPTASLPAPPASTAALNPARRSGTAAPPLGRVDSRKSPEVVAVPSVHPREPDASSPPELWQRASRGLRDKDFDAANGALNELMRQGSATERESARLVQAQVLLAQGRPQDAELSLRALAESALSPKVRQKARELLAAQEDLSSQRSFPVVGGANQP